MRSDATLRRMFARGVVLLTVMGCTATHAPGERVRAQSVFRKSEQSSDAGWSIRPEWERGRILGYDGGVYAERGEDQLQFFVYRNVQGLVTSWRIGLPGADRSAVHRGVTIYRDGELGLVSDDTRAALQLPTQRLADRFRHAPLDELKEQLCEGGVRLIESDPDRPDSCTRNFFGKVACVLSAETAEQCSSIAKGCVTTAVFQAGCRPHKLASQWTLRRSGQFSEYRVQGDLRLLVRGEPTTMGSERLQVWWLRASDEEADKDPQLMVLGGQTVYWWGDRLELADRLLQLHDGLSALPPGDRDDRLGAVGWSFRSPCAHSFFRQIACRLSGYVWGSIACRDLTECAFYDDLWRVGPDGPSAEPQ